LLAAFTEGARGRRAGLLYVLIYCFTCGFTGRCGYSGDAALRAALRAALLLYLLLCWSLRYRGDAALRAALLSDLLLYLLLCWSLRL
jgi:hypothetical protein